MSVHYLVFGTTPELSKLEWQAVYPAIALVPVTERVAKIDWPDQDSAEQLVNKLGGLVKVLRSEQALKATTQAALYEEIGDYLATHQTKPEFGLTEYGSTKVGQLSPQTLKNDLKSRGISARFLRQEGDGMSAAILLHQKRVIELNLIHEPDQITLAKTIGVQNIDDWTIRDRSKPYADRKKGMLPPKVARIMVNIGVGQKTDAIVYDPFCGSGTVLMEAALLGSQIVGSDLDATAMAGTEANLQWLTQTYPQTTAIVDQAKLQIADVTHVMWPKLARTIDVVVTEPFLGKPKPQPEAMKNIFRGLEKLYLGAFKQWLNFLKPGATLVMVWPMVKTDRLTFNLEHLVDKIKVWGYTLQIDPPVRYARPGAIVERQIVVLKWHPPQGSPIR